MGSGMHMELRLGHSTLSCGPDSSDDQGQWQRAAALLRAFERCYYTWDTGWYPCQRFLALACRGHPLGES